PAGGGSALAFCGFFRSVANAVPRRKWKPASRLSRCCASRKHGRSRHRTCDLQRVTLTLSRTELPALLVWPLTAPLPLLLHRQHQRRLRRGRSVRRAGDDRGGAAAQFALAADLLLALGVRHPLRGHLPLAHQVVDGADGQVSLDRVTAEDGERVLGVPPLPP